MIENYIKVALRIFSQNKGFAVLNILGLAIGIACAAYIFLWVENELKYDDFNQKRDLLYIIRESQKFDDGVFTHSSTPALLGPAIKAQIPGIVNTCRVTEGQTSMLFTVNDKPIYGLGKYAEPSIFTMFTLPFVQGNAADAFSQLNAIVVTQKMAKKLFGNGARNAVGKSIRINNGYNSIISGVVQDLPQNSTMQFE